MKTSAIFRLELLLFPVLIVTIQFFSACNTCSEKKRGNITEDTTAIINEKTAPDGQQVIYDLWKYESRLSPLKGEAETNPEKIKKLLSELQSVSFIEFPQLQRNSLQRYRDKIIECHSKEGFTRGYCIAELTNMFNAPLADFALDQEASLRFNDSVFTERIKNQANLMKVFSLGIGSKLPSPEGTALVFAEVAVLSEKLVNAGLNNLNSHMVRVAFFAIDPSMGNTVNEQTAIEEARKELIRISKSFAGKDWNMTRLEAYMVLMRLYYKCNIDPSQYAGTKYSNVADIIKSLENLK